MIQYKSGKVCKGQQLCFVLYGLYLTCIVYTGLSQSKINSQIKLEKIQFCISNKKTESSDIF